MGGHFLPSRRMLSCHEEWPRRECWFSMQIYLAGWLGGRMRSVRTGQMHRLVGAKVQATAGIGRVIR